MRSPLERWIREHREAILHADKLVELLAPSDIQSRLVAPDQAKLRQEIARHLQAAVKMTRRHFRIEEEELVPAIRLHLDADEPRVSNALGCLEREHAQMHLFAERASKLLPLLKEDERPDPGEAAEILRVAYGMQSVLRHHCTKEEQDVYPLLNELPAKVAAALLKLVDPGEDIPLDHLVKPLGEGSEPPPQISLDGEGPEN